MIKGEGIKHSTNPTTMSLLPLLFLIFFHIISVRHKCTTTKFPTTSAFKSAFFTHVNDYI